MCNIINEKEIDNLLSKINNTNNKEFSKALNNLLETVITIPQSKTLKILEQFDKRFFTFGDLCSKPNEHHRDGTCCGFYIPDSNFVKWQGEEEEGYCIWYDEMLDKNKRCNKCKDVLE